MHTISFRRAPSMLLALERILTPSRFPRASGYHLFKDAYFGRDALEVAEDLLDLRPDIARAVILRLASLQGTVTDPRSEEEPGKIHHEYRALSIEGEKVDETGRHIFHQLAAQWQMATTPEDMAALSEFIYYGTVDATPLYIRLVSDYCCRVDPSILDEEYTPRRWRGSDRRPTIRESVRRAVEWTVRSLEQSDLGLLEFRRMTPRGHRFQAWKDGATSYVHLDGQFANYNGPIASIEVQGLAHDALVTASSLLPQATEEQRARWTALAARVCDQTLDLFWMPDQQYFAMALDRDPATGAPRQVQLIASNPASMLDSGIFDALSPERRKGAVAAIVERIYSDEFLTPAGIRCNCVAQRDVHDYMAYQSSYTVWHKETYDIARGLRRQGFPCLAEDLEVRILNSVNIVGGATEFLYVMPDGRVDYDPFGLRPRQPAEDIVATNVPENDQGWSISAALAIKWRRGRRDHGEPAAGGWQAGIEQRKLQEHEPVTLLRTQGEIEHAREQGGKFSLNAEEGYRREQAFLQTRELPVASA
jgi:glycogen debranching enzyme